MTSPAAERGHQVRQRLLAAAVELIPERGWTAVSTRVLAERAGVTPSVVHYHFPSLQALLCEAVLGAMRRVMAELDARLDTADDAKDVVHGMLASADQYTGADPMSLLFIEAYLAATRDERFRDEIAGVVEAARVGLGRRLAARRVTAPDETAAVLLAALDGLLLHRGLGIGPDAKAAVAVLGRLVTRQQKGETR
jgi:AcrR family transcriptional regulator